MCGLVVVGLGLVLVLLLCVGEGVGCLCVCGEDVGAVVGAIAWVGVGEVLCPRPGDGLCFGGSDDAWEWGDLVVDAIDLEPCLWRIEECGLRHWFVSRCGVGCLCVTGFSGC